MKTKLTLILTLFSFVAMGQKKQIKPATDSIRFTDETNLTMPVGTSFNGSNVTFWSDKRVEVGDMQNIYAMRDSTGKWSVKDTLKTISTMLNAIEVISKYDREQGDLHAAAIEIVYAYQTGDHKKINRAYNHYKHLLNKK